MRLGIHGDGNRRLAQTMSGTGTSISGSPFAYSAPMSQVMYRSAGYAADGPVDPAFRMVSGQSPSGRTVYSGGRNVSTGGMVRQGETLFTPPAFYSPYHTPSAWQIPTNRREVYRLCEYWIVNEPRVAIGILFYSDFPMNGFELVCKNRAVRKYFEKLCRKLKLQDKLPEILREYYGKGDCFVMANLDCKHCRGTGYREDGTECEHEGATWDSLSILNPEEVEVAPWVHVLGDNPPLYITPNNELRKIVQTGKPEEIFARLPEETKAAVRKGQPIKLNPLCVHHFKHGAPSYQQFGVSLIRPLFPTLFYRDKLRQAQWLIAERHIVPIKIIKIGTPERPASPEDISDVQEQISEVANDPLLTIVTHHAFDYEWIGASGKVLQLTNEFDIIEGEMIDGLGLSKAIMSGEGPTYANAQVGIEVLIKRLETVRRKVATWIEEKLFKPIAEFNGFTETDERGEEDSLVYPTVKWNELRLRDNTPKLQALLETRKMGDLSARTWWEENDIDPDQEIENLRLEQMATVLSSPDLDLSGINSGIGGGYGGGGPAMPPEMGGGMPPPAGLPPGAEGAAAPGMPPGAAPAGGGAAPPMPPPPGAMPTASTLHHNYRRSQSVMDDARNRIVTAARSVGSMSRISNIYENAGVVSVQRQDSRPVTGDGYRGPLDVEPDMMVLWAGVGPSWGAPGVPLQQQQLPDARLRLVTAMFDSMGRSAAGKDDVPRPKSFMTKLEGRLLQAIVSQRYPYQFWAQYMVNGDPRYRVDFAFPQLKIAVQADGEEWHSGVEDIQHDKIRDSQLASQGWVVLRFTEEEIEDRIQDVVSVISQVISSKVNSAGVRTIAGNGNGRFTRVSMIG